MTKQHYNVFISYNSKDKPVVSSVVNELWPYFSIWFDNADMLVGEDWLRQVTQGLKTSDTCAIFLGKDGLGPGQLKEVEIARTLNVRMFFVRLPGGSPEAIFKRLRLSETTIYINLSQGINRATFELLVSAILGESVGWDFLIGLKLTKRAREWIEKNKPSRLLYRDDELKELQDWLKRYPRGDIDSKVKYFIEASQAAQISRERSQRNRTASIFVLIITLIGLGGFLTYYFAPSVLNPPPQISRMSIQEGAFQPTPISWLQETPASAYYLNKYEISTNQITVAEYNQCVRAGICPGPIREDGHGNSEGSEPISDISWEEADRFCRWVGGRMPTDIEIRRYYSFEQDLHSTDELDHVTFDWTADWCSDCSPPNAFKVIRSFSEPRAMSPEDKYSFVYFRCAWDPL